MYDLPKIRMSNVLLRPILSMINSPCHKLVDWLAKKLEPIRKMLTNRSLKDRFRFSEELDRLDISDKFMISLDVSSMFKNIPVDEIIDIICQQTDLLPQLKQLLLLCTKGVQFQFNNQLYWETDEAAIGSPLGPNPADIFMAHLKRTSLNSAIK
ncbi:unnamed protein product [Heterobilharzia americana]|nr:unnamed protein product [Heterobilharzia americana]